MPEENTAPTIEQPETPDNSLSLLAAEKFGDTFKGETPEITEEAPEIEEPETPEVSEEEAPEAIEAPEEQTYELDHIAQLLGVETDQLDVSEEGRVILSGKVDGQNVQTETGELLKNWQMMQAADKRLDEAKAKAQKANEESMQIVEAANLQLAAAGKLVETFESKLVDDEAAVDWKTLREEDPAEYSAKKQEFQERKNQIEALKAEAGQEYQQAVQQQQEVQQAQMQEHLVKEHEALISKLPEWKNEKVAAEEKGKLGAYLMDNGFSQEDVGNASDHRLIIMARKAMLYDQGQANTNAAAKKVVKVPKVMKPGAPKPENESKRDELAKRRAQAQKSGTERDAFALLQAKRAAS